MNLLEASKIVHLEHVKEAVRQLAGHADFNWLYARTGRREPEHRYVVVDGRRYPSKAFGFFVAQLAGNTENDSNDMNVNQAVAPLVRLGYSDISGSGRQDTTAQRAAREESYYLSLARPQQARFRQTLLAAYGGICLISGCKVTTILEAAHVVPFRAKGADTLQNGILLRIDFHRLFDADELAINPDTMEPIFSKHCASHYRDILCGPIQLPEGGPSSNDFSRRWKAFR